jgi:FAD/FMN-containing dehydrogenase
VLYLNQKMSDEGTRAAEQFTRELIDATLQYGSTYYFPYQRYATGAQIRKAYPLLDAFIQKKVVYDPKGVFYNTSFDITGRGK